MNGGGVFLIGILLAFAAFINGFFYGHIPDQPYLKAEKEYVIINL